MIMWKKSLVLLQKWICYKENEDSLKLYKTNLTIWGHVYVKMSLYYKNKVKFWQLEMFCSSKKL